MADSERSGIKEFLLPEKTLSLKVLFDNIRNFVIIGSIFLAAKWLQSGRATAPPIIFSGSSAEGSMKVSYVFIAFGLVLFALNAWQTVLIFRRVMRWDAQPSGDASNDPSNYRWYVQLLGTIAGLFFVGFFITMCCCVGYFVIFLTWFPVGSVR